MMKLRYNPTSSHVRKCVVMIEKVGLGDRIGRAMTHPWAEFIDAHTVNPMGKVLTLILEDGRTLYDNVLICEYLDTMHDGPKMFPS